MPKKKRAAPRAAAPAAAPAARATSTASQGDGRERRRKAAEAARLARGPAAAGLERALWAHNAAAAGVALALVASRATAEVRAAAAASALWLGRAPLAKWSCDARDVRALVATRVAGSGGAAIALLVAALWNRRRLLRAETAAIAVVLALLELVQLRSVLRANGRRTVAEILASAVEAGFAVGFVATYTVNVSNLPFDANARWLTGATAAVHTLVIQSAIYALEHATAAHVTEFQASRNATLALLAKVRDAYRVTTDDGVEAESTSKRKKKARAKLAASSSSADETPPSPPPLTLWRRPSVQFNILLLLQTLLLALQLGLLNSVILARDWTSILVCSSIHVAWTLRRLKMSAAPSS